MQEDPSLIVLFSTLIFLLILSGFFSGSETGMMAANKIKLRNLSKKSKTSAKRALDLLKRPDQLLSAILVGNNFANILASAIVTIMMLNYFGGNVVLGSIILTIVILIFSEITPKTMAAIKPESFATRSSFILNILVYIFKPLIFLTNFLSKQILKIFKLDAKDATLNENLNTEELRTLLEESGDLIPKQYRKMLSSVLGMEELIVEDIISLLVDRTYTATQYALLASIGTAGRTTLASSSGALVDWLNGDWGVFFILTAIMVIPSLIILWIIRNKLKINEK